MASAWNVQFVVSEANYSKIMHFALGLSSGVRLGGGLVASALEKGVKLLYGGLPVDGRLTVDADGVEFESNKWGDLIAYDRPFAIRIPKSEIMEAEVPSSFLHLDLTSFGMRPALVILRTSQGEFKIVGGFRAKRIAAAINAARG